MSQKKDGNILLLIVFCILVNYNDSKRSTFNKEEGMPNG